MIQGSRKTQFITGALFLTFSLLATAVFPSILARVLEGIPGRRFDVGAVGFVYWVIFGPLALVSFLLGIFRLAHALFGSRQENTAPKSVNPLIILVVGLLIAIGSFVTAAIFSDFSPVLIGLPLGAVLFIVGLVGLVKRFAAKRKSQGNGMIQ